MTSITESGPGDVPVCPRCSTPVVSDANFCSSCGLDLRTAAEEGAAASMHEPTTEMTMDADMEPVAFFVVVQGPKAGSRFELTGQEITVGRHSDSDIFLDDITVSRHHAVITHEGSERRVQDMGSLNGTYLNRGRVENALLKDGDELQIGRFKLVYASQGGA